MGRDAKFLTDFVVLQSFGYQFDNAELARARLLKRSLDCQQMAKLGLEFFQSVWIGHVREEAEQLTNALCLFGWMGQGRGAKNISQEMFELPTTRLPAHKATAIRAMMRMPIMW